MKAVIIHHQDDAPAGLLLDRLSACGVDWRVVDLGRGEPLPAPESVKLAVSLGSDASADDARDWIARELDWLRAADRAGTAILGLCFGAQALAVALGGGVARAGRPERGWITISTAEPELVASGPWLSWHDDVIELPPGARLIAENACGPQAFAAGRHLGVQFHPEVTPEIVADWVLSAGTGELDADTAVDSSAPQWPGAVAAAERLFDGFAARVRTDRGGRVACMGERTKYTAGTFSWTDLSTTDQDAAKTFYTELFGWEINDAPIGDGSYYSMASIGGKDVAAISTQPQQQRDAAVPPTWNSYITVQSADAALERAGQLGGTVHAPAFDVMDVGRMGVVQDPQGAFFMAWEPKSHIGAGLVNAPGALSWNELASTDMDGSGSFYTELFGWTLEPMEGTEMPYSVIMNTDRRSNGGIRPAMQNEPSYWLVYFGTDDIDASSNKIEELGGTKMMGPMSISVGQIAVAQDPQGAVFALYAGDFDD